MTKPSDKSVDEKPDEALRRMLNTPRTPHEPVKAKPKKVGKK
jgi:hypothetical protein